MREGVREDTAVRAMQVRCHVSCRRLLPLRQGWHTDLPLRQGKQSISGWI